MLRLEDFLWGFGTGVFVTIAVGWLWGIYRGWIRQREAFRRPQAVGQTTGKTPEQVYRESVRAESKIWLARIIATVAVWMLVEVMAPEVASQVRGLMRGLLRWIIGS